MTGMTVIVKTVSRLLFPFILLFGAYIVIHGHVTPGGGFPGGVVIAAALIVVILAFGADLSRKLFSHQKVEALEILGGLFLAFLCILGLFLGAAFLQNTFPTGEAGQLFSGGNLPLLYIAVGFKVAGGLLLILYAMTVPFHEEE